MLYTRQILTNVAHCLFMSSAQFTLSFDGLIKNFNDASTYYQLEIIKVSQIFSYNQFNQYSNQILQFLNSSSMQDNPASLSISKVKNILKLEQLFYNKFLTVELLHELVSLYTSCIQSTDQHQSDLRFYFLQKIQFVLSRPQTQLLLNAANNINEKGLAENLRQTFRSTARQETENNFSPQVPVALFDKKRLYNYDGDKPEEKKKKIDIQLKLMNEMEQNMKNLSKQVRMVDSKFQQQNLKIKGITDAQNSKLQERLAKRKNKVVRKRSVDLKEQSPRPIDKKQLIEAQTQLNQAVERLTIRLTKRLQNQANQQQNNSSNNEVKGRVKRLARQQSQQN